MNDFSYAMRDVREALGYTQEGFAEKLGVDPEDVAYWESLDFEPMQLQSARYIRRITETFSLPANFFDGLLALPREAVPGDFSESLVQLRRLMLKTAGIPVIHQPGVSE